MVALIRSFVRVTPEGKLPLPTPLRRAVGLAPGQLVELKLVGAGKKSIMVSSRPNAR